MAKLPVTQGATRRAYSRAAWQARRRWLATKLMGQQPRRAEPREGRASREQLGTCFPTHGNCSSSGEGKCACLPGIALGWRSLVDQHLLPQFHLPRIGLEPLRHPSTCQPSGQEPVRWTLLAVRSVADTVAPREFGTSMEKRLRHGSWREALKHPCPTLIKVRKLLSPLP